ncbi:MAG: hypothetical protein K6C98_06325 [Treponema sp.]|nr:hypothetical protein [Treponema sp.]
MELITFTDNQIKLCTGLSESTFSKTKYSLLLTEKGLIASANLPCENLEALSDDFAADFTFEDWTFDTIASDSEEIVYYSGKLPQLANAPVTLESLLQDEKIFAVKLIFQAIIKATESGKKVSQNGGGILFDSSSSKIKIIFLPEEIFKNSVNECSKDTCNNIYSFYKNPLLDGNASLCFMLACIYYRLITKNFPFSNDNKEERIKDILDKKFLPLEYAVNGFDREKSDIISKCLSLTKENQSLADLSLLKKAADCLIIESKQEKKEEELSEEAFEKRKAEYIKAQTSKITAKRKFKSNSAKLLAAGITLAILLFFIFSTIRSNAEQPTTAGLSPVQVTENFFQSINQKDIQVFLEVCKGTKFKPYESTITNMHVANAAAQAYTFSSLNMEPEKWFFYAADENKASDYSIYGISNLKIDGYPSLLDAKINKKKQIRQIMKKAEEEGSIPKENSIKQDLSYYIVQTNPESGQIEVELAAGNVELSWIKNRWILTDINIEASPFSFSTEEFLKDYKETIKKNDGDIVKAAGQLRMRYPWVPEDQVLQAELQKLKEGHF